jgi:hypothetical protein
MNVRWLRKPPPPKAGEGNRRERRVHRTRRFMLRHPSVASEGGGSPCRKRAGWSWRRPDPPRSGHSAWHGRGGDGRIRRSRPAATPQKPMTGRPRHDHRTVLNVILAVVGTELSWRDIPKEYGKRDRAYKRYRLWQDQGLWPRIIAALADPTAEVSL